MPRRLPQMDSEEDAELNMTPMLDVVFILLIFFIVTAVFVKLPGQEPAEPDAVVFDEGLRSTIILAVTADDEVWFDRKLIPPQRLLTEVQSIQAENPKAEAIVQADKDASHGVVYDVMEALRDSGIQTQRVAIEPVVR